MPSSATAAAPTPAGAAPAVPAPAPEVIQAEIANTLALEQKLNATIDDLKAKRETGESAFVAAIAKELAIASVPLTIDTSPAFKSWKTADGVLEAKAKASEEALEAVRRHISRLEHTQPDAMRDLLERRKEVLTQDLKEVEKRLGELGKSESKTKQSKA
jgi:flagellar motility protein MotE (MotC chaperone)